MAFQTISTTILTHPLQLLLVGMILSHGVRAALAVVRQQRAACGEPLPSNLQIAA
jgi:hypothetical protein